MKTLKVAAIGGGTGLATLLSGLRPFLNSDTTTIPPDSHPRIELTAIVTVTDDGRSSGRLRSEFDVPPPGDIRNCLVALSGDDQKFKSVFKHRFAGRGSLGGHSLGNLVIVALTQITGSFLEAIEGASNLLGVEARVLPATLDSVDLEAQIGGRKAYGQRAIKAASLEQGQPITNLTLRPANAVALPEAVKAIQEADIITLGPGSLFTSVMPNLLIQGIADAIQTSNAICIYICNIMTEADETAGFSAEAHLEALRLRLPNIRIDLALFNSNPISSSMRELYAEEEAVVLEQPTSATSSDGKVAFLCRPIATEARFVRHNPEKLAESILEIYEMFSNRSAKSSDPI